MINTQIKGNVVNYCEIHHKPKIIQWEGGWFCRECSKDFWFSMKKAHNSGTLYRQCIKCGDFFLVRKYWGILRKHCYHCYKELKKEEKGIGYP